MTKKLPLVLYVALLVLLEMKVRLWSGYAPNILLIGLITLSGSVTMIELISYTLFGFLLLSGPIVSEELLVALVIIAFIHFLHLFVFGPSPLLAPLFGIVGTLIFYIETTGRVVFFAPLFMFEILLVSILVSFLTIGILFLEEYTV